LKAEKERGKMKISARRLRISYLPLVFLIMVLTACLPLQKAPDQQPTALATRPGALSTEASTPQSTGVPTKTVSIPSEGSNPRSLELVNLGAPRNLPSKIFGASVEALVEHFTDNPPFIEAVKTVAPADLRFPGGSQSNYYNWQDGLLHFNPQPSSSGYYKFWANLAPQIAQAFPKGVSFEAYAAASTQAGADVILVPNLENSTVNSQAEWFTKLAAEYILPEDIELGNEFWIAMAGDPAVMKIWPNEPASMQVMHQYEQVLRPIVGTGAKFAIQASAASFTILPSDPAPFSQRLLKWDEALTPADWFDAVTMHLYPNPEKIASYIPGATPQQFFSLMMGRSDAGIDRAIEDIAARLPGKEIWVTEWNPRGGNYTNLDTPQTDMVSPQMNAQLITRTMLAFLRHPEVTKALYFMLYSGNSALQSHVLVGNTYEPMVQTIALTWLDEAANGGGTFQRVVEKDGIPVSNVGPFQESYLPIEGGLFHSVQGTVLILQNASQEARLYDPAQFGANPQPKRVEILVADNFADTSHVPAQVLSADPSAPFTLPPYSIARITW